MWAFIRSEVIKLTTTRTALGLLLGATVVAALGAVSTIMSAEPANLARPLHDQPFLMPASINLALFALVLGIWVFTDEFRHGSIVPTLVITPDRRQVVVTKMATSVAAGVVLATVAVAAMFALAVVLMRARGAEATLEVTDLVVIGGFMVAGGLWAAIGVAVGAMVRHQVAAIVGALVWVLVVENLAGTVLGDAAKFLPGQAAHAVNQVSQAGALLAPTAGALVLVAYAFAAGTAATLRMTSADITPA